MTSVAARSEPFTSAVDRAYVQYQKQENAASTASSQTAR